MYGKKKFPSPLHHKAASYYKVGLIHVSMLFTKFGTCHLQVMGEIKINQTRQCFSNLRSSILGDHVPLYPHLPDLS